MESTLIKIEEEIKKPILEYFSQSSKQDSFSQINPEKNSQPKISIIIPIFNEEKNIIPTIRSIQNQTLQEIEILCINDNSNDNTPNILEKLKKEDTRITILTNKIQRGDLFNLINGGLEAKGEYITYIYSKDFFANKDALNSLYEIATKKFEEKIDVVHYQICGIKYNKENIDSMMKYSTVNLNNVNKVIKKPYIEENYFQKKRDITESRFAFDKIYKKNLVQKIADFIGPQIWNQKIFFAYDFLFTFACMKLCDNFVTIPDIFYCREIKDFSDSFGFKFKLSPSVYVLTIVVAILIYHVTVFNEESNKKIGDYMQVLERIFQLIENEKELGEFRENILKELLNEKYLNAIGRSIFYDKFVVLFEKIYNWKFGDSDTKKRIKEDIKNIIKYRIEPKKKFVNLLG